jgi:hypothetical protein
MASCDTVNNVIKWVCVGLGITAGGIVLGTGIKEGIKFWAENNPAAIAAKQAGGLAAGGLSLAAGSLNAAKGKGLIIPGGIEMSNLSGNIPNSTDFTNAVNSQVGNAQSVLTSQVVNTKDAVKGQMDSVTSQATDQSDKLNSTLAEARRAKEERIAQGLQATSNLANTANTFTKSVVDKHGNIMHTAAENSLKPFNQEIVKFTGKNSDGDPLNIVTSSTNSNRVGPNRGGGRKTKSKRSKLTNEPKVKKPRTKKCLIEKDNKMYMSFCI